MVCSGTAGISSERDEFEGDFVELASECLRTRSGDLGWTVGEHVACLRSRGIVTELMTSDAYLDEGVGRIAAAKPRLMRLAKDVSAREWRRYRNRQVWLEDEDAGRHFRRGVFLGFLYAISDTASRVLSGEPLQSAVSTVQSVG